MQSANMARVLLLKGKQDQYVLNRFVEDPSIPDETIGFHAQQAVEKMIKAVLAHRSVKYRKTHQLEELVALLQDVGIPYPPELSEAVALTPFAVELRYDLLPIQDDAAVAVRSPMGQTLRRTHCRMGLVCCRGKRRMTPCRPSGIMSKDLPSLWRSLAYLVERFLLGRRILTARLPEFGLTMRVPARDAVGRHLYKYRVHEPLLSRLVVGQLELRPDDVVFDVGANIGWYSLLIGRHAPPGVQMFAFEPAPANYELLVENLRRNGISAVTAVQAAVGQRPGRATLHLYGESNRGRNSLLHVHEGPTVDVAVTALDDFCRQHALAQRPIAFLKLDIEGYEVLRSSRGGRNPPALPRRAR